MPLKSKALRTEQDLTPKQRKFIDILVANWGEITKGEALKKAGYECKNNKNYSDIASRLTSRKFSPHIVKYLDKKLEKASAKYEKDKLRRYKRLEKYADGAYADKQYASAINAEYRSGQLAGLYVDKREVKVSGLEGMSRAELEKKLSELSNKIDGFNAKTIEVEPETKAISQES
jgi:phage terminase small subunit|tara:strand:+ start:554 stop:1078 length:525 start_codon:yes stop_codon:yes gene_type:complete